HLTGVWQFAGNGFENVSQRQQSFETAELVDHESYVSRGLAHLFQGTQYRYAIGQVDRCTHQAFDIRLLALEQFLEQLLLVDIAQRLLGFRGTHHDQARVRRIQQYPMNLLHRSFQVDAIDLHTVGHHLTNRLFGQAQYAANHHPLAAVEQLSLAGLVTNQIRDVFTHFVGLYLATKQTQYRVGGTLTQTTLALQATLATRTGDLVEHLDENREADGRVQVALGNVETQAFGGRAEADHHEEAQAQHDHRRARVDEGGQRLAGDDHQADGDDHRDHHHFQMLDHTNGGDHRIQREHRVEHDDLRHHRPEPGIGARAAMLVRAAF